ncbi:hypothetical protein ACFXJ8_01795 [Nonomuraea sp. NPDC059194]|uniref:hypothetical protein n=1 Tax=Nonomuraea sp. NPDC059194 TaxID=3346764 RepID=UPI00367D84DA
MRLLAALALLAALVLAPAGTACACSCATLKPKEAVKGAAAVFIGTVKAVRRLPGSPLGPRPPYVVTFAVDQVYKGDRVATVELATNADSASCGYDFTAGARYLVFAASGARDSGLFATDPGTALYSSLCSGNVELKPGSSGPLRRGDEVGSPVSKELLAALGAPTRPTAAPTTTPVSPEDANDSSLGGLPWGPIAGGAVAAAALAAGLAGLLRRR